MRVLEDSVLYMNYADARSWREASPGSGIRPIESGTFYRLRSVPKQPTVEN